MPSSDEDLTRKKSPFTDTRMALAGAQAPTRDHGAPLGPLAQQFVTLTYSLLDTTTVGDVLQQITNAALHVVPGADLVSVTLRSPDGTFHTPIQTDPIAVELDRLQYELREGPCLTAADPTGPTLAVSDDLASDQSWPRFGAGAAELGMGAVLATALVPDAQPPRLSGALNIYSRTPGGLRNADHSLALLLATHASLALAHTREVARRELKAEHLLKAIDSRDVIGQAKGILMGRRGMTADEAFDVLRRTSQTLNVKLVELAQTLTQHHTELDLPDLDTPAPR